MATSGYQIIDFKNIPLSSNQVVIKGIYDSVINCKGKCLMASNVNIADNDAFDKSASYWVNPYKTPNVVRLVFAIYAEPSSPRVVFIRISQKDEVSVTVGSVPTTVALSQAPTEEVQ